MFPQKSYVKATGYSIINKVQLSLDKTLQPYIEFDLIDIL